MAKNRNQNSNKNNRVFVNGNIRAQKVRCIDHNDENIGIISKEKAIKMAEDIGLDLVQVSYSRNDIPTCKIIDYGKYKYDLSKKEKSLAKKQRESIIKIKEVKFRPNTDVHDLKIKAKMAERFITEGHRVKVSVFFKGRETQYQHFGTQQIDVFLSMLNLGVQKLDEPKFDGRTISVIIEANKSQSKDLEKVS